MFSLLKRLVIAVEKIAANSMSKEEHLNLQIEHSQKELLFRAEYKQSKGIELSIDEQLALERLEREKISLYEPEVLSLKKHVLLKEAYDKKVNGIPLSDEEAMAIESYENQKQIK
jgi:hypothetical protein